jgi:hypothetical protein
VALGHPRPQRRILGTHPRKTELANDSCPAPLGALFELAAPAIGERRFNRVG